MERIIIFKIDDIRRNTDFNEDNLAWNKIPAVKHRAVELALLDYIQANIAQQGDIKRVKCTAILTR
jgi:hypothetical protein